MLCYLGVFSVTAPIGIIISFLIYRTNLVVDVIFLSISGGTFIYVACTEVIVE
jgi:zinc transporter ZupT